MKSQKKSAGEMEDTGGSKGSVMKASTKEVSTGE